MSKIVGLEVTRDAKQALWEVGFGGRCSLENSQLLSVAVLRSRAVERRGRSVGEGQS